MNTQLTEQTPVLNETLSRLLNELGEECQHTLKLLAQLEMSHLTSDQLGDILGELSGAIDR